MRPVTEWMIMPAMIERMRQSITKATMAETMPRKPRMNLAAMEKQVLMKVAKDEELSSGIGAAGGVELLMTVWPILSRVTGCPCISRIWRGVRATGMIIQATM